MRTQAEWKVDTHIALTTGPTRWRRRSCISLAALLVKVIARIAVGGTRLSLIRWATRWVRTRVLPDPAPATIRVGPSVDSTASRWASFNPASRSGEAASAPGSGDGSTWAVYERAGSRPFAVGGGVEGAAGGAGDAGEQVGQLHGHHELGRGRGADLLEGVQVLQGHGVGVDGPGHVEDLGEGHREPLGAQDRGLPVALGGEDGGLLLALGDRDRRPLGAGGLGDHRPAGPLGRHLPGHRVLHLRRRGDLADLDVGDLDPPALGDVVE